MAAGPIATFDIAIQTGSADAIACAIQTLARQSCMIPDAPLHALVDAQNISGIQQVLLATDIIGIGGKAIFDILFLRALSHPESDVMRTLIAWTHKFPTQFIESIETMIATAWKYDDTGAMLACLRRLVQRFAIPISMAPFKERMITSPRTSIWLSDADILDIIPLAVPSVLRWLIDNRPSPGLIRRILQVATNRGDVAILTYMLKDEYRPIIIEEIIHSIRCGFAIEQPTADAITAKLLLAQIQREDAAHLLELAAIHNYKIVMAIISARFPAVIPDLVRVWITNAQWDLVERLAGKNPGKWARRTLRGHPDLIRDIKHRYRRRWNLHGFFRPSINQ